MRRTDREISEIKEVEKIIQSSDVCRIAIANDNLPYIVTMNFGYTNDSQPSLYFHCADEGKKLDMIRRNNYVCFEMDTDHNLYRGERGCDWGMSFKSVLGYGRIELVTGKEERIHGLNCIMKHYGGEGEYVYHDKTFERTTILKLEILEMTGKKK
jgi:uncharacterized protein